MTERIKLVQGDTRPKIVVNLKDSDGTAIDCSGATVRLKFRASGSTTVLSNIVGTLLTGFVDSTGSLVTTAPYDTAGKGGRVQFAWPAGALDVDAGNYEGEVEITFADTTVQTVYDLLRFKVRQDF